jgi:hypothetical protein
VAKKKLPKMRDRPTTQRTVDTVTRNADTAAPTPAPSTGTTPAGHTADKDGRIMNTTTTTTTDTDTAGDAGALALYELRIGRNNGPKHPDAGTPMAQPVWDAFVTAAVGAMLELARTLCTTAGADPDTVTAWVEVHTTDRGHYDGQVEESAVVTLYHAVDAGGHATPVLRHAAGALAHRFMQDTVAVVVEGLGTLVPAAPTTHDDPCIGRWLTRGAVWAMNR